LEDKTKEKGYRRNDRKDGAPPKTSSGSSGNPAATRTQLETGKDVFPVQPADLVFKNGTYHDYWYFAPNRATPQAYLRTVSINLTGWVASGVGGGTAIPTGITIGTGQLYTFWLELYLNLLHKAVRRDYYRHLPDTLVNPTLPKNYFELLLGARETVETLLTVVNSESFNSATKSMRTKFGAKYRRLANQKKALAAFRCPKALADWMDDRFNVVALRSGGAFVASVPDFTPIMALITGKALGAYVAGGASPMTALWGLPMDLDSVNDLWDEILVNVDDAIATLNGTAPANTWNTGFQDDLKYFQILLEEMGTEPIGMIEDKQIMVNAPRFQNIMYGEAIYGYDLDATTLYAFPVIDLAAATPFSPSSMIPRRGFEKPTDYDEAGMGEVWAAYHSEAASAVSVPIADVQILFGCIIQYANESIGSCVAQKDAFRVYDEKNGWYNIDSSLDHNDGGSLRTLMTEGNPLGDHQWNDFLFAKRLGNSHPQKGPAGVAAYQFHQPFLAPFESYRSWLCGTFDVPFYR
jgi:hypothetical protein